MEVRNYMEDRNIIEDIQIGSIAHEIGIERGDIKPHAIFAENMAR